jgi:hypothetical protein
LSTIIRVSNCFSSHPSLVKWPSIFLTMSDFAPPGIHNVTSQQRKPAQHLKHFCPFRRAHRGQYRQAITPLAHIISLRDVIGNKRMILHDAILQLII